MHACARCADNVIKNNYIADNPRGMSTGWDTSNNRIYHKNFLNNTFHYTLAFPPTNDMWHNRWECEGNYYDTYSGEDTDDDGVGDTILPRGDGDYYPLMSPWFPSDINHDGIADIRDLFLVARALGAELGHPLWNPHADVTEDGIINNDDLGIVSEGYGEFLVEYNKPLTVLAKDQYDNLLTSMEVWIDEASVGYTGASFTVFRTLHEVRVQPNYTEGTHTYTFTHWEDFSTENPRILMTNSTGIQTITAYYWRA